MTGWFVATMLLIPAFAVPAFNALRGDANNRLAAVQVAGGFAALILATMSFAFDQPSFMDLALALTLLTIPGTYLLTLFMERWL